MPNAETKYIKRIINSSNDLADDDLPPFDPPYVDYIPIKNGDTVPDGEKVVTLDEELKEKLRIGHKKKRNKRK